MQRTPQVDYPAAHSMDTYWFAVDDAGEVAFMSTSEPGPAPKRGTYIDGLFDIFDHVDQDANGIPIFPVDRDLFPDGLTVKELEDVWVDLPESERNIIEQLAVDENISVAKEGELKVLLRLRPSFLVWLNDPDDIKKFKVDLYPIVRLDPMRPIFHVIFGTYLEALSLLLKGRLLAWREIKCESDDEYENVANFYGMYAFTASYALNREYLNKTFFPPVTPAVYKRFMVPKQPRIGLPVKNPPIKHDRENADNKSHAGAFLNYLPGVNFSKSESIQIADIVPCYNWGRDDLLPDSADSVIRRNMIVIHEADAAERDRHVVEWHHAAKQGDLVAQYTLAYFYSQMAAPDDVKVFYWYHKAAEQAEAVPSTSKDIFENGSAAQCCLADMYERGVGVLQNDALALDWYKKSASKGNYLAQYRLGMRYKMGQGVAKDRVQARFWLKKSASDGYGDARRVLWSFPNFEGAEQGDKDAQYELAQMYEQGGRGVEKDDDRARHWHKQSAAQGNACAQYQMGRIYMRDGMVPPDLAQARHWLVKATAQGNDDAKRLLKDTEVCIAAERGDMKAMYALAYLYQQWKNYPHAVYWYRKAAEQAELAPSHSLDMFENGSAAQCNLADKYEHGLGVAQDDQQALDWYRKSAALNNHVAQYSLGMMYMRGRGVPKDMAQARAWLIQSAEQGYDKARSALQEIATLPEG